ncbi:titin homolog [Cephus cinctus]|uniref:Titin homolog n=1 Tax=Cephus cinctus TaxID=211228 RepID=A0AAJ7FDH8_CEPCN|nr:titin homolog [Cephus cinctus]XP_015586431.1 titin homolog [Cephus cinctus]XP_015586432.1 titin homolog [Cephus cinctus]XP_024936754.1 titin homolog [Cephus cinctus]XP_024936755.1 titin homolog [Cephus cinctus]
MASNSLEEKINKIRQQNEEIRRRHEEVEADKKNAAKLNALVKMVPSTDWPERKEPPEFSNPLPRTNQKPKPTNREHEHPLQYHAAGGNSKKVHIFAEGDGPPPDPKYNFLADSEREEHAMEEPRDNERNRGRNKPSRGSFRKRGSGGRDVHIKDFRGHQTVQRPDTLPEYEAWRAERNRIDEARISRQRTAEGSWRREWDIDKVNIEDESLPRESRTTLGDIIRKDHKDLDKRHHSDSSEYTNRGRGGNHHFMRGTSRGSHNNRGYHHSNSYEQYHCSTLTSGPAPLSPTNSDERTVTATDKSIKITLNQGSNASKGPVMSVKVSSPSIAGTGRVGPRQKTRVMYSSQSENEIVTNELETFPRQKSFDDKSRGVHFNPNASQSSTSKSPHPQRKKDSGSKSPFPQRKEFKHDDATIGSRPQKRGENESKSPYLQRKEFKDFPKSPHSQRRSINSSNDSPKSPYPQKRTVDKSKDLNNSESQRPHRRVEKSKSFNRNSSRTEQSHENTVKIKNDLTDIENSANFGDSSSTISTIQVEEHGDEVKSYAGNIDDTKEEVSNTEVKLLKKNNEVTTEIVETIEKEDVEIFEDSIGHDDSGFVEALANDYTQIALDDEKEKVNDEGETKTILDNSTKEITDGTKDAICDNTDLNAADTKSDTVDKALVQGNVPVEISEHQADTPDLVQLPSTDEFSKSPIEKLTTTNDSKELQGVETPPEVLTKPEIVTEENTAKNKELIISAPILSEEVNKEAEQPANNNGEEKDAVKVNDTINNLIESDQKEVLEDNNTSNNDDKSAKALVKKEAETEIIGSQE